VSVRPSVCPIRPLQQRAARLLLWARQVAEIDRLQQHGGTATARGRRQCHANRWRLMQEAA